MTSGENEAGSEPESVGLIGKTLGRYQIRAELGRGGMATVYRAVDPGLGREVAVKVMHGTFAGRADIERRFRREAQAVAALKHEAIVDVYDFAPAGAGQPAYIVSELIEGPTLRQLLDERGGRLWPEAAALFGARLASALGAAHDRGIVHRDVKPDNVMIDVRRASGSVRVVLTDFGVAHVSEADAMTATGSIVGSPAYMSPEQAAGKPVGAASDVFSLGALLYHVATGRTPFSGSTPVTMIAAILRGELMRPSQVDARVGPAFERIVLKCLKPSPAERYPDGNAVRAALQELLREGGIGDETSALRSLVLDPQAFERDLAPRVAAEALAQAHRSLRRGELSRALAETNRVFAYAPGHPGAEALLARISRRRRWGRAAIVAGAGLVLAGGTVATVREWREWRQSAVVALDTNPSRPRTAPHPMTGAAPSATAPVPRGGLAAKTSAPNGTTTAAAAGAAAEATVATKRPPRRVVRPATPASPPIPSPRGAGRGLGRGAPPSPAIPSPREAARAPGTPTPASPPIPSPREAGRGSGRGALLSAAPAPVAETHAAPAPHPLPAPPPAAAVAAKPPEPARASLVVRAAQGFCSPSVDEHPPAVKASFAALPAGPHRIYCTMPQGGPKVLVATYDLRAGTHPNLVIVPGPTGAPMLGKLQ